MSRRSGVRVPSPQLIFKYMSDTKAKKTATEKKTPVKGYYTLEIDGKTAQLSKPTRQIMGQAMGMVVPVNGQVPDITKAGEWILRNCWIDGDKEILEDDDLLFSASMSIMELLKIKQAEIKKN